MIQTHEGRTNQALSGDGRVKPKTVVKRETTDWLKGQLQRPRKKR